jgi:hypothetical protein
MILLACKYLLYKFLIYNFDFSFYKTKIFKKKEFLKKEFSQENIDFWVKCDNFEKLTNEEEMKRVANEIWYVYLDTSSMTQINVDSKSRASCKEGLSNPNNKMFERAKNHVKYYV